MNTEQKPKTCRVCGAQPEAIWFVNGKGWLCDRHWIEHLERQRTAPKIVIDRDTVVRIR